MKMIRKICLLVAAFIAISSCSTDRIIDEMNKSNQSLEDKIKENSERIAELESLCSRLNSNLSAIQIILDAVHGEDWVKAVTPIKTDDGAVYGYILEFAKSGIVTIFNGKDGKDGVNGQDGDNGKDGVDGKDGIDGKDGYTPEIEIRKDIDGVYYWVIDGKWMTGTDGQRIPATGASGITPELRIKDGFWEISYDRGTTWTRLEKATGEDGKSFFKDAKVTDEGLSLTLSDGTLLTFPQYRCPVVSFDVADDRTGATTGIEVNINYQIRGQMPGTSITATSDGNYSVKVTRKNESSGVLTVTPPAKYTDGYINVIVSDPSGYSLLRVINFHENKISFPEGLEYNISQEGGTLSIPLSFNFDADIVLYSDWLTMAPKTKSEMRDSSIVVMAPRNESFGSRQASIYIYAKTNKYQPYSEIVVNQASASFSLSQSKFAVPYIESTAQAEVFSSIGLRVSVETGKDWLRVETRKEGNNYHVTMNVSKNTGNEKRNGTIALCSEKNDRLGTIQVIQMSEISDSPDDMVFTVRANFVNDYTSELPLDGLIDCYVDWGDGSVDYYNSKPVRHKYNTETPASYVVRISGKVEVLHSPDNVMPSVIEVNQWGKTGLWSVSGAFDGNSLLRKVAGCANNELAGVYNAIAMFRDCYNLQEIPSNLFSGCELVRDLAECFNGCRSLTCIPDGLFQDCKDIQNLRYLFGWCPSLQNIPSELFKNCTHLIDIHGAFTHCSSLHTIPEGLFDNNPDITYAGELFTSCVSLSVVPISIFDHNRKLKDIDSIFEYCEKLQCESPYTLIDGKKVHLYERNQYLDDFSFIGEYERAFYRASFLDRDRIPKNYK